MSERPGQGHDQAENFFRSCCNYLLISKDPSDSSVATLHIPCCPNKSYEKKAPRVTKAAGTSNGQQHLEDKENVNPNLKKLNTPPSQSQNTPKNSSPCGIGIIWRIEQAPHLSKEVLVVDSQESENLDHQSDDVQEGDILVREVYLKKACHF